MDRFEEGKRIGKELRLIEQIVECEKKRIIEEIAIYVLSVDIDYFQKVREIYVENRDFNSEQIFEIIWGNQANGF